MAKTKSYCVKYKNECRDYPTFWLTWWQHKPTEQTYHQHKKVLLLLPIAQSLGSDSEQTAKAALDETTRQILTTSEPQQFLNCDWIYLIDSGGQIEFLEALPAFLQHTSVCLFVTKLSEMLSERPKIEYFGDGRQLVSLASYPMPLHQWADAHALCADSPDSVCWSGWQYKQGLKTIQTRWQYDQGIKTSHGRPTKIFKASTQKAQKKNPFASNQT